MASTMNPDIDLWFQNTLVTVRVSEAHGQDSLSVLEHRAPQGDSPPLHVHHSEDEVFVILEGEFRMMVDGKVHPLGPGAILIAPKGLPHTFQIDSPAGGRFLTITAKGDFERFVRAMARPAERPELPEFVREPSAEAVRLLTATAARYGIEFVGPPLP